MAEAKSTIQEPQAALGDSIIPEEQQPQAEPQTTVAKPKPLSPFDLFAGQLLYEARQKFGQKLRRGPNRQPHEAALNIARQIDGKGFKLRDELQPAQWSVVANHNEKHKQNHLQSSRKSTPTGKPN